jgi:hypothetical protein
MGLGMTRRTRKLRALLFAGLLTLTGWAMWEANTRPELGQVDCVEDLPCWNCRTMGNRLCGPESED